IGLPPTLLVGVWARTDHYLLSPCLTPPMIRTDWLLPSQSPHPSLLYRELFLPGLSED
ncbi:hypothetical protein TNCT_323461, partial [Trichonephila clavata]